MGLGVRVSFSSFFRTFTNVYIHSDYVYDTGTTTNTTIVPSHHGNGGGDSRSKGAGEGQQEGVETPRQVYLKKILRPGEQF
jgi:hypothetical protein